MIYNDDTYLERIHIKTIMFPFVDENQIFHNGIMKVQIMNNLDDKQYIQQVAADMDFIIYKNTNFKMTISYETAQAEPYNLQDYLIETKMVDPKFMERVYFINSNIVDAVSGTIELSLSEEEINNIYVYGGTNPVDTYYNYTVVLTSLRTGRKYRILQGIIKVEI